MPRTAPAATQRIPMVSNSMLATYFQPMLHAPPLQVTIAAYPDQRCPIDTPPAQRSLDLATSAYRDATSRHRIPLRMMCGLTMKGFARTRTFSMSWKHKNAEFNEKRYPAKDAP